MKRFSTLVTAIIGFLWAASAQSAAELATVYKDLAVFETPMALSLKKGIKNGNRPAAERAGKGNSFGIMEQILQS
ncbi:hypothetical protein LWM68_28295 [Niabella sp. W65]|nr:hypothetical protein [Niabella sp. W65]MCH7366330.1 hypothetical protein [Niabella sp. W65]ULT42053.1 hypothetical protein KRR40_47245 [Niabella sp. I65]